MTLEAICCSSQKKVGCKNSAGWLGSTSLSFWVQPWGWFYKRDKEVSWLLSECPWTVVRVKGKELMQIDSQSFLFPYSNGKKLLESTVFQGMADGGGLSPSSGKFSVPTVWIMSWSFTTCYGDTFWSAEQFSGTKASQHLRVLQALPPRAKERSRCCTKSAELQSLASQVFFSIWDGVWGTLPNFPFYLGKQGSFCSKAWKQNGISTHLWNPSSCWQTSVYPGKALTKMLWKSVH